MPKFSIITVCLNEPRLERTCASIVNQTYQDFEWIVIDGGSNAETLAIFEKYKSRMNYFVSEPDGGIYFGMNKGIAQAAGEWLNFMNAGDCFYAHDVLAKVAADTEKYADYDILYGGFVMQKNDGRIVATIEYPAPVIDKSYFIRLAFNHQSTFIKGTVLAKHGNYDTDWQCAGDMELFLRIFVNDYGKYHSVKNIITYYNMEGASAGESAKIERNRLISRYFTVDEIKAANKEYFISHCQMLRGGGGSGGFRRRGYSLTLSGWH
ncbi:MAG: glycosyltransferase [Planctomycetota bacterium]|jgi:glycosyltransferase involved in cell wall biosynthesis|nr:glycosyltransferase [Planctomycetota bacterium]